MKTSVFRNGALALAVAAAMPLAADELQLSGTQPNVASEAGSAGEFGKAGHTGDTYIVELVGDPVATYDGGVRGFKATSNKATGANRLDTNSKASKAYRKHLKNKQADFKKDTGISSKVTTEYQIVLNGMAVRMSEAEAEAMAARPDVLRVTKERIETLNTDVGPEWINAEDIWGGPPNNVNHSQGEGLVINASRAVLYADAEDASGGARAAAESFRVEIRRLQAELRPDRAMV